MAVESFTKTIRHVMNYFFFHFKNTYMFSQFQGFINVRVWFPKLPGVVMMSDQEVIIMCKPPERVVTQNKAAGFAGAL